MTKSISRSSTDSWGLAYHSPESNVPSKEEKSKLPTAMPGIQIFGAGTTGCKVTQRVVKETLQQDGVRLATAYIDYPIPEITPLKARLKNGESVDIPATPFCAIGDSGDRRDRANRIPLLAKRYGNLNLLRGTPVWEDRKLALSGEGGGALPPVAALDIDLNIDRILAFLAEYMRGIQGFTPNNSAATDFERLIDGVAHQHDRANRPSVTLTIVGGAGASGNACAQLLAYPIRRQLKELGLARAQSWAVILGPQAFKGLTPFVFTNYRALMHSLDHTTRHGLRREYANGLTIDMQTPPYDQVFLIDDTTLEKDALGRVTEVALDDFTTRAARTVRMLLMTSAWDTVRAKNVNNHESYAADGVPRFLTVLNLANAHADRRILTDWLAGAEQAELTRALANRLTHQVGQ